MGIYGCNTLVNIPYFCLMDKKTGLFAFILLALLILLMAWATLDDDIGSGMIYNSVWFTLLWILAATVGCYFVSISSLHRRLPVFLLHIAFLTILSGALTTRLTGKTGQVHLRENQNVTSFFDEWTQNRVVFPFSLSLKSFSIEYYPGTDSPANYVSVVELIDAKTGKLLENEISMNNILRYKGYRFYQASFDEDWRGSILSVNHDRWGILLSYSGYFLMFFSMLWVLFDKKGRFRFLLKKLTTKALFMALLLAFLPTISKGGSDTRSTKPETIDRVQAEEFGTAWVEYHGRITPIQTLANDFTAKITGKNRYKNLSSEQFFFGWLFFPEYWKQEPVFKIKSEELKRISGSKDGFTCLADFINEDGINKLEPYYHQMYGSNKPEGWLREAIKLNDKFYLIEMLQRGNLLKIPSMHEQDGIIQWKAPNMDSVAQNEQMESFFNSLIMIQKEAGDMLPSDAHLKAEQIYNSIQIFSQLFKICLSLGFLCLLFFIFSLFRNSKIQGFEWIAKLFRLTLWIIFALVTIGLGLRTFIGGRLPLSNGYETMLLLAWFSLLTGILAQRYSFLILVFSFLLSGFTLLVAHLSSMNPQITPLVPVLQSPLLSVHVLVIMIAYGLCGFMALNSLTALIVCLFGNKNTDRAADVLRIKEITELLMYPATFLMGAGIFIGAIWANISWGRYWGWDPKEVWALISFLLMSFTFHGNTLTWFKKPVVYHVFVLIVFLSVLMTYFGVNYLLGGKHSYV